MHSLRLLLLLVCASGCFGFSYAAKRIYAGQKNYVVNFSESEAKKLLANAGITNRYVYGIERDSSGTALFVHFEDIGTNEHRGTLIITESGLKIVDLPHATGSTGFLDNLTKAYSYENGWCVFANGSRLLWKNDREPSRFSLVGTPGNEILVLHYDHETIYRITRHVTPETPIFTIEETGFKVKRAFYKDRAVFVFGVIPDPQGGEHWECWTFKETTGKWKRQSQTFIPDTVEVLDFDPGSPNILCYRWGLGQKRAFLFNLETKSILRVDLEIWRDHGYFLHESVVRKIAEALKDHKGEASRKEC